MNQDFSFSDESLAQYKSFLEKGESVIDSSWEKFFEGANFKVWRALKEGTETYKYRSIGRIDCPAEQYFAFYRDLDYWKTWDNNVAALEVLEKPDPNSEIIYWAVSYPFPLANRDYVYKRFSRHYETENLFMVRSGCIPYAARPPTSRLVRVTDYECVCACQPSTDGTYCTLFLDTWDDPKLSIPGWVLSWVTSTAIPTFLQNLNLKAQSYRTRK
eukprot:TRINITY_DN31_c0_g1_i3.p1 TRINITY_DN31_c0_g1~~TRINITY_DN31_c0_g1_i3.p1  ORF type:complete len:215 (+),score=19.30 TRINITY_DN31_c0_g1_i3:201-845(+)